MIFISEYMPLDENCDHIVISLITLCNLNGTFDHIAM